jgi:hypothetical protein
MSISPPPTIGSLWVAAWFGPAVGFGSVAFGAERVEVAEVCLAAFGVGFAVIHVQPVEVGVTAVL